MKPNSQLVILCFFLLFTTAARAQPPDSTANKRLKPLLIASGVTYGVSLVALNKLWYSDFDREPFHFFNDSKEWKQIDKAGHFYSAFHISATAHNALKWAGLENKQSLYYSSAAAFVVLTSVEVFDGFSSAYGASASDLLANTTGILFFYGQQKLWQEIRVHPKFSFRSTKYAELRPEVLGSTFSEQLLKDYNGQTYWLSLDVSRFSVFKNFPKWLNIAVGYGGQGMVYAEDASNVAGGYRPMRQYYLALDLDVSEYQFRSPIVNTFLYIINMIHIPAPALEFSNGKFKFHYIY